MKFILVDSETLLGTTDTKEGVKRMTTAHFNDTGRHASVYCTDCWEKTRTYRGAT